MDKADSRATTFKLQSDLSALITAIHRVRPDDVSRLLTNSISDTRHLLSLRDASGRSVLHHVADKLGIPYAGDKHRSVAANNTIELQLVHIAQILLAFAPSTLVACQDNDGNTALHMAIINGHTHLTRLLLQSSTVEQINIADHELHTAVHWATVTGQLDCLAMLLDAGALLNCGDIYGATPLHYATQQLQMTSGSDNWLCPKLPSHKPVVVKETGKPLEPDAYYQSSRTAQALAHQSGETSTNRLARKAASLAILEHLLSRFTIDVNCADHEGRTPLLWSASSGT